jgi:multicomponent Na+:H+ antiporter subunit B
MKNNKIFTIVAKFVLPFILIFGFYIEFHGKYSPGGGFQAGVIIALAFICYHLIYGNVALEKIISYLALIRISALGVFIYGGVGLVNMLQGGLFLDYNNLLENRIYAQQIGITIVEFGVGLTVFATTLLIFMSLSNNKN